MYSVYTLRRYTVLDPSVIGIKSEKKSLVRFECTLIFNIDGNWMNGEMTYFDSDS